MKISSGSHLGKNLHNDDTEKLLESAMNSQRVSYSVKDRVLLVKTIRQLHGVCYMIALYDTGLCMVSTCNELSRFARRNAQIYTIVL